MSGGLTALTLDFLSWLAAEPRQYADTMEAWRTSCPRLTVWEDTIDAGLIVHSVEHGRHIVRLTPHGEAFLATNNT